MPQIRTTALLLCVLLTACAAPAPNRRNRTKHLRQPDYLLHLIIFYDGQTGPARLMQAVKDYGATLIYEYRTLRGIVIRPPQNVPLQDAAAHFEQVKGVLTVNQDQITPLY